MPETLKYIVNNNGHKSSVLVPVKVWEDLNNNYQKLQKKLNILSNISDGINEIKQAKKTGRKLQTLKDFLK
ncbi:MAG: hypothetical protein WKF85_14895 [Chitinophagaceae bacterium]